MNRWLLSLLGRTKKLFLFPVYLLRCFEQHTTVVSSLTSCLVYASLQHKPPLEINDLFEDIKDGVKLLGLLEVLSGQRLVSVNT